MLSLNKESQPGGPGFPSPVKSRVSTLRGKGNMQNQQLLLSVDCGTQSSRAIVWDPKGYAVSEGRQEFEILNPHPGWYEQDAKSWWEGTRIAIRNAIEPIEKNAIAAWRSHTSVNHLSLFQPRESRCETGFFSWTAVVQNRLNG